MAYFITVDLEGVVENVFSDKMIDTEEIDESGEVVIISTPQYAPIPVGALPITNDEFSNIRQEGFGSFTHNGSELVARFDRAKVEAEVIEFARQDAIEALIAGEVVRIRALPDVALEVERSRR